MHAQTRSSSLMGIRAIPITVEVDITLNSLPKWNTVGLADSEVKESKERVIAAIKNSGYDFTYRKITINLAPAHIRKEGTALDLPIALGLLAASKVIPVTSLHDVVCVGELSLDGRIRPVRGVLSTALMARDIKSAALIVPSGNIEEAGAIGGLRIYAVDHLTEVVEHLAGRRSLAENPALPPSCSVTSVMSSDLVTIRGQWSAKRALEVACAGGHNILLQGSPGAGKTMLASCVPGLLPLLTREEALETSQIYSLQLPGEGLGRLMQQRPFRHPHHSVSNAGMIGGGKWLRPGEVSLAHHGVLFLDEVAEFRRDVLELLRQPLEEGSITLSRVMGQATYPARFMLVAAMNPCPCGYLGHFVKPCQCLPQAITRYQNKLSGPLLDRIDLQINVPSLSYDELTGSDLVQPRSSDVRQRVLAARERQRIRWGGCLINSRLGAHHLEKRIGLEATGIPLIRKMMDQFHFSVRAYHRVLKVARTIADLADSDRVKEDHLLEAFQYRLIDGET